jgi:hypothetical protein
MIREDRRLFNNGKHLVSVDRCSFGDANFEDAPGLWRLDLVLHLHRFDYDDPLTRGNLIAAPQENANDFPRHRSRELLLAFGTVFDGPAMLAVDNARGEQAAAEPHPQRVGVGGPNARFADLVAEEHQIHSGFKARDLQVVASLADRCKDASVASLDLEADLMTVYVRFVFHV